MRNRLRVLRAERSWTQQDLAERAGVSRQTIHSIEAEKYDPSLPLAFTLARIFGLRIEDIFEPGSGDAAGGERPQGPSGDPVAARRM